MLLFVLPVILYLVSPSAGHGYVQEQTVGGTTYTGYLPWTDPYHSVPPQRIIRSVILDQFHYERHHSD